MSALYEDEFVQLFAGDYRDYLPMLEGLSVDAVITDPPYGETSLAWDRWVTGWVDDAASIADVLWSYGSFRMFFEHADEFDQWKLAQDIVWEKHNGSSLAVMFYRGEWSALRHVVPTTADATARTVRRKAVPAQHLGSRGESHFTSEDGGPRMMRSVMAVRSEHGRAIHPTQKPLGIVMPLIEYSVPMGGLVVDLFAGSATTALAARMAGRRCIAFEGDVVMAEKAAQRLAQQTFDLGDIA